MKKCCFTGHRNVDLSENLINTTTNIIIRLIEEKGVTEYYGGGAIGWDMLCERIILMLKQKYPFIHLHLFLPCPPENQTEFWIKEDKDLYYKILAVADSVKVISPKYIAITKQITNTIGSTIKSTLDLFPNTII